MIVAFILGMGMYKVSNRVDLSWVCVHANMSYSKCNHCIVFLNVFLGQNSFLMINVFG
jgi:hypothetical protein